jgi:hypothetical protein
MLLGRVGVALAAKPAAPKAPLGVVLAASGALDLLCFGLVAAGIERIQWTPPKRTADRPERASSYPWSHGLLMAGVWSAVAAAVAARVYRDRRTGGVIGLVVFSHWLLDFVAHARDPPVLFDGSPRVGLGLSTQVTVTCTGRMPLARRSACSLPD